MGKRYKQALSRKKESISEKMLNLIHNSRNEI